MVLFFSSSPILSIHSSAGSPYGRNFSRRFCSSLAKRARLRPSLLAAGESSRRAAVGRAHLEEHAHLELAELLVREVAVQVVHRVAPGDQVHAQAGAVAEDQVEVVGRASPLPPGRLKPKSSSRRRRSRNRGRSWMKRKSSGPSPPSGRCRSCKLAGHRGQELGRVAPAADLDAVGQGGGDLAESTGLGMVFGRAVEHEEPGP